MERDEFQESVIRSRVQAGDSRADAEQWERDVCAYGFCWCGRPRRGEVIGSPDSQGDILMRMVCYAGHVDP